MSSFTSAVTAPFRFGAAALAAVGGTVALGTAMVFNRARGWGVYLSRTRIDYATEIGDPSTNSAVGMVVGWLARNFPEAPVRIVREDDPTRTPIPRSFTGPGAMLRLLENPNPHYDGVLQWNATIVDFIQGDAYWLKRRAPSGRVTELWWVPARMMEPRWPEDDPTVFISHYDYTVDGVVYRVKPQDVVHFRYGINSRNPRKGQSRLEALSREIFTDDEAANFTASLLKNLGVPGVVIAPANTAPGVRADPAVVKKTFMESFGGDRRGEPMVMTAPTEVKVLSFNPQQMELRELRRIPEERISGQLGVPAGVAGLGAGLDRNTFTNYGEAKKAAITEGLATLHRLIAATLEVSLLPEFVDTTTELLDVYFDIYAIAAMQDAAGEVWKRNESAATKGLITRADFKRAVGLVPDADGADDVYIVANNFEFIDVSETGGPSPRLSIVRPDATGSDPAEPEEPPVVEEAPAAYTGEVRCTGTRANGRPCNALLAEHATAPYRFTCHRSDCRTVVESGEAVAVA